MIDQVDIMRSRAFPTAMVLPQFAPISIEGTAAGPFITKFESNPASESIKYWVENGSKKYRA